MSKVMLEEVRAATLVSDEREARDTCTWKCFEALPVLTVSSMRMHELQVRSECLGEPRILRSAGVMIFFTGFNDRFCNQTLRRRSKYVAQSAILFEVYTTHIPSRKFSDFRPERFTLFPYVWSSRSASELESCKLSSKIIPACCIYMSDSERTVRRSGVLRKVET